MSGRRNVFLWGPVALLPIALLVWIAGTGSSWGSGEPAMAPPAAPEGGGAQAPSLVAGQQDETQGVGSASPVPDPVRRPQEAPDGASKGPRRHDHYPWALSPERLERARARMQREEEDRWKRRREPFAEEIAKRIRALSGRFHDLRDSAEPWADKDAVLELIASRDDYELIASVHGEQVRAGRENQKIMESRRQEILEERLALGDYDEYPVPKGPRGVPSPLNPGEEIVWRNRFDPEANQQYMMVVTFRPEEDPVYARATERMEPLLRNELVVLRDLLWSMKQSRSEEQDR